MADVPDNFGRQLWNTLRGHSSILSDRPVAIPNLSGQPTPIVENRLRCFTLALGLTIATGLVGTAILYSQEDAPVLVRHLWGAIGALLGVTLSVAVTRSELRAFMLLLIGGVLTGLGGVLTGLVSTGLENIVTSWFAPQGRGALGGYFVGGTALGIALGVRAVIAYQRSPSVTPRDRGAGAWGLGRILVAFSIGTFTIYWFSQKTAPGAPSSNAVKTALFAACVIGLIYHFVDRPPVGTPVGPAIKRQVPRVSVIGAAGLIAEFMIDRMSGDHSLPYWAGGLADGCLAGLFLGYLIDLSERPFVGRRRVTAAMTLAVVVFVPALRLLAFYRLSMTGISVACVGAVLGFIASGGLTFVIVRVPDQRMSAILMLSPERRRTRLPRAAGSMCGHGVRLSS